MELPWKTFSLVTLRGQKKLKKFNGKSWLRPRNVHGSVSMELTWFWSVVFHDNSTKYMGNAESPRTLLSNAVDALAWARLEPYSTESWTRVTKRWRAARISSTFAASALSPGTWQQQQQYPQQRHLHLTFRFNRIPLCIDYWLADTADIAVSANKCV